MPSLLLNVFPVSKLPNPFCLGQGGTLSLSSIMISKYSLFHFLILSPCVCDSTQDPCFELVLFNVDLTLSVRYCSLVIASVQVGVRDQESERERELACLQKTKKSSVPRTQPFINWEPPGKRIGRPRGYVSPKVLMALQCHTV